MRRFKLVAVTNTAAGRTTTSAYEYDAAGNLTHRVTAAGTTGYAYDEGERLTSIQGTDETVAYAYNPWNGLVETETRGGGLRVGYAYDELDRVTGLEYRDAASNLVFGVSYAYDAVGMITQKVSRTASATNVVAYAYDELDRLVREDDGATAREYDYDLAGNRTAMRVIAGGATNVTAYTLGTGNRLASWTGGGACAYDAAGCVTNLVRSGKPTVALEWDARYRVTAAYTNGVVAESYGYDALGRRATVTANSITTHYINEGPHVVAETDAAGNLLRRYEYGPGVDDILTMTVFSGGVTNTYRYVKDIQNTVLAVRDAAGAIVESYEYDAWGNLLAVRDGAGNPLTESAIGNRYLFQGREYSWTTGLYNFRARWYDPVTGRWMSNDPIGISGGLNQYVFCANNPVNESDPWGLCEDNTYTDDFSQKYENKYVGDLRRDWYVIINPLWMAMWSTRDGRDVGLERKYDMFRWRRHNVRGDQLGNAVAAFALTDEYGPVPAWIITRFAEVVFALGTRGDRGHIWEDARGSFEMNDLGIEEYLKTNDGQRRLQLHEYMRINVLRGH